MRQTSVDLPLDYGGPVDRPFESFPDSTLDRSIIDRFEQTARRFAARIAIADTVRHLTYAELARLVTRITAATLQIVDGRPGPVAILLPRDACFPAAMLGVLAAGRGYVPLDVSNPVERNRLIATQSGAAAFISANHFASLLDLPVVNIDAIDGGAVCQPAVKSGPDDPACIVYTSGSTGTPKGVQHSHRNLLHMVMQRTNAYHLNPDDRLALLDLPTSISGLRDIFLALLNGASLHILPPNELGPAGLVREFEARQITMFRTAPVLLRRLADALGPDRHLDSIRLAVLGGQRVDWSDFDAFERLSSPGAFLHVGTGLTETAGQLTGWFVDRELRSSNPVLPVGRIHPGLRVTIVGETGEPIAEGEIGEFVVSGRYITQGYWRDPELTARVFSTDAADPQSRTFKTGDWGRLRDDGLIEFVGRMDEQIKLNGHRIELGEIEVALRACAGVEDAIVLVRKDDNGLVRSLSCYAESKPGVDGLTARELAAALRLRLPDFMIPGSFTIVDALPRLPNLKIDREELRRRDQQAASRVQASPALPTEVRLKTEEMLLRLWREVLDRQDIGYDDDFFLCGGNSIAAVDLVLRVEKHLQYQVPLTLLAEAPTVSQLCLRLETMTLGAIDNMIRVHTAGSRRPLFAVPGGGGHALGLLPLLRSLGPEQPCYGLQPPGMDWTSVGCTTLPEIATYYLGEIRTLQPTGPYRLFGDSFGGLVVFEIALQLQRSGESVEFLGMLDTYPPRDLPPDKVDCLPQRSLVKTSAPRPECILGLNDSISHAHTRFSRAYALRSGSDQHTFRGELTYFYSTGTPVAARRDPRRLWPSLAARFRLLPVPGPHGTPHREPQYTILAERLRECLNRDPVTAIDPAGVFDRDYRMDDPDQPANILSSTGEVFGIHQAQMQGVVEQVRVNDGTIRITGWALEPGRRQPAQTVAVFLDDRFIGYGACGEPRPDIVKQLGEASNLFAGFDFIFENMQTDGIGKPRLFVLSGDGHGAELAGIEPVAIGSTSRLANTRHSGVILEGNWSSSESWGVWSDGGRAAVTFDASSLPELFRVEIKAKTFPPRTRVKQQIRVSHNGKLLKTLSNWRRNRKFIVEVQKQTTEPGTFTSVTFDIESPTSPQELKMSADSRKLGIGLISLRFKKQPWWRRSR
jgi:amino acid adenylation domain-containing protein